MGRVLPWDKELFNPTNSCDIIPPLDASDHNGILATFRTRAAKRPPQYPRSIWRYDHADFELANELLSQVHMDSILIEDDTTTSWARWEKMFLEIMKQCIPQSVLPKRKNLPWLSKSIIQLMRKRDTFQARRQGWCRGVHVHPLFSA